MLIFKQAFKFIKKGGVSRMFTKKDVKELLKSWRHFFFVWVTWYYPALRSVFCKDCGFEYQGIVTAIFVGGSVCMVVLPILVIGGIVLKLAVFAFFYLLSGLAYLRNEYDWNGRI